MTDRFDEFGVTDGEEQNRRGRGERYQASKNLWTSTDLTQREEPGDVCRLSRSSNQCSNRKSTNRSPSSEAPRVNIPGARRANVSAREALRELLDSSSSRPST